MDDIVETKTFVECFNSSCGDCLSNCSGATAMNESGNATGNVNKFYFYETETLTFLWILFALIMIGNSVVVFILVTSKSRKSRTNYFIFHLAFADLAVGMISVLTDIFWKMTVSWNAGNVACKIIKFFQILVTYSSTYVLVALSIDRCDAITRPMNFTGSWRRARYLVVSAWVISALFSLPYLYLYEEKLIGEPPSERLECWIDLGSARNWQLYVVLTATSLFFLPAILIAACYIIIVVTIWSKGQELRPASRKGVDSGCDGSPTKQANCRGLIPKAKIKTVKMTFVIVSVFVLCWSPYFVFNLLQVFHLVPENQTNLAVSTFIQSLAPLNSAANPIIYCLFSGCPLGDRLRRFQCVAALLQRIFPCCSCTALDQETSISRTGTRYTYVSKRSSTPLRTCSRPVANHVTSGGAVVTYRPVLSSPPERQCTQV